MISIVDDDKSVRESANSLIRSLGYATATFASGEEFLESGCLSDTECLITDVKMPGMSGVELQSRLIANGNRTPVILVTADPDERVRERALGAGALGFLIKPINEESLIAVSKELPEHTIPALNSAAGPRTTAFVSFIVVVLAVFFAAQVWGAGC